MKKKKIDRRPVLAILLFFTSTGALWPNDFLFLESALLSLKYADEPQISQERLILTFQRAFPTQFVGVRFEHESYRKLHIYQRNPNGVFFLVVPLPTGQSEIKYRICVDGLWMRDPFNPQILIDPVHGSELSVVYTPQRPPEEQYGPMASANGTVCFTFHGQPGQQVSIVGSFNHWDPFSDPLNEERDGLYKICLRLGPGTHHYAFMVDGRRSRDPFNPAVAYDRDENPLSVVDFTPSGP